MTPSSVSRHLVEATSKQLKQFQERSLDDFSLFAMYLDTVHRGGQAFVVALGVNREGKKLPLGFWEGATENHEICEELLEDVERRGLKLSKRVLWVTDGGGGIIKALKSRYGKKLIHQRCTLHKDRNIQRHLPKRYRKQAHHLFTAALEQNSYKDAKKMLQEFERWLRDINESAADSLVEALEEVLMLHKLKVPALHPAVTGVTMGAHSYNIRCSRRAAQHEVNEGCGSQLTSVVIRTKAVVTTA